MLGRSAAWAHRVLFVIADVTITNVARAIVQNRVEVPSSI